MILGGFHMAQLSKRLQLHITSHEQIDNQRLGAESTVPASQLTRSGDICSV